jgi:Domain of unknown function (DUF6950)
MSELLTVNGGKWGKTGFPLSDRSLEKRLALPDYVEELSRAPWVWGECDCTMAIAEWIKRIIGTDPLAQYRGRYHSASDAKRIARRAGGFLPALGALFEAVGLERTQDYETGDVAAFHAGSHVVPVVGSVLAIRFGLLWVCKAPRGVVGGEYAVIAGWRL